MYTSLIDEAKEKGIEKIYVAGLIRNASGQILLIEKVLEEKPIYHFPTIEMKMKETIQQALQRAVMEETSMQLCNVKAYLGHYDLENARVIHFIVEVADPYAIEQYKKVAYAWLETQEAIGYPITDQLRGILDIYAKMESEGLS